MAIDPNLPPTGRDRMHNPNMTTGTTTSTARSGSSGLMIGVIVLAIIALAAFFMWPDRASNVAGQNPATTGTTAGRALPGPSSTPAPASTPTAPSAPAIPNAPANTTPATPR